MKKLFILIIIVILSGCSYEMAEKKGAISFTDHAERTVSFEKPPSAIIAMSPADVEIVFALGGQDKLVAVGSYSNYPAQTETLKKVETGAQTNIEEIIALGPDCIIMAKMAQEKSQTEFLADAGINVVIVDADNINETYSAIGIIGMLLDKTGEADRLVESLKSEFEEIRGLSLNKERKSVYVEISPLEYGLWTCGKGTFQNELLEIVGAENIFGDIDGWQEVSEEQVLARSPGYILTSVGENDGITNPVGGIYSRESWLDVSAIKNNRVYQIDPDKSARAGPRLAEAAWEIYDILYGE